MPVPLRRLIPTDTIIEVMNEKAWDVAGEYAEDWPDLTPEDKRKLEDLIARFLRKRHVKEFCDIQNTVKKIITKDDIRP
jgi:predicted house-cleaning noncanonical NTP pyrophosphatase (MazG superfamily)